VIVAAAVNGAEIDSSDLIFNDTIVNDYRISFYQDQWDTLLRYNKEHDEVYMPARFTWIAPGGDSVVLDSVGVRYKGNSSYVFAGASPKKPFKIAFDKYRNDQRFFSHETLNFSNSVRDPSCMREKISYAVLQAYMPAPRAAFATLTLGGRLEKSLYTQVEQVDKRFLRRHFDNDKYNLYKASDEGATLEYRGRTKADYNTEYELKTNETADDWKGLVNLIDLLNNTTDDRFVGTVGEYLDLDNCIRYLAFTMVNADFDSYTGSGRNYYLYDNRAAGAFNLIPWDLDQSFGMYGYSWKNVTTVDAFDPSNLEQRPLMKRILSNDSLRRVYAGYMQSMIDGPHSVDSIKAMAYRFRQVVDSSVNGDRETFYSYEQFTANIDTELVIQEGITRTVLPGLVSVTGRRNANLQQQIENALPVIERPSDRSLGGALLWCDYHAATKQLVVRCRVPATGTIKVAVYTVGGARLFVKEEKHLGTRESHLRITTGALPAGCYTVRLTGGGAGVVSRRVVMVQ
jgi:spore coat protein CotH